MSYHSLITVVEMLSVVFYGSLSLLGLEYVISVTQNLVARIFILISCLGLIFFTFFAAFQMTVPLFEGVKTHYIFDKLLYLIIFVLFFVFPALGFFSLLKLPKYAKYRRFLIPFVLGVLFFITLIVIYVDKFMTIR